MKLADKVNPARHYCAICATHTTHGTDGHDAAMVADVEAAS